MARFLQRKPLSLVVGLVLAAVGLALMLFGPAWGNRLGGVVAVVIMLSLAFSFRPTPST